MKWNLWAKPILGSFLVLGMASLAGAQSTEWEESSPYYEDDAWYDISEWMDGNEYNPVDEQYGVWDDEVYDSDVASSDRDNDRYGSYGYDNNRTNDWFYDRWYPGYSYYGTNYDTRTDSGVSNTTANSSRDSSDGGFYDRIVYYRDTNGDGRYDAYTGYYDYDEDGTFDRVVTYSFTTGKTGDQKGNAQSKSGSQQAQASQPSAKRHRLQGEIANMKPVKVRGTKHTVVQLKYGDGKMVAVDLGQEHLKDIELKKGTQISVEGPMTKAGDKQIIVAQSLKVDGKSHDLSRKARKFEGTVVDVRNAKLRGQQHTLVMLKVGENKQRLVDLGRTDRIKSLDIKKDSKISVRGVPFAMKDRPVVLAQSVQFDGKNVAIDRRPATSESSS